MPTYKTKPRFITAEQFLTVDPENLPEGVCMCPNQWGYIKDVDGNFFRSKFHCHTKSGVIAAEIRDYIVKGDNEYYPVKEEEFEKRYERVYEQTNP